MEEEHARDGQTARSVERGNVRNRRLSFLALHRAILSAPPRAGTSRPPESCACRALVAGVSRREPRSELQTLSVAVQSLRDGRRQRTHGQSASRGGLGAARSGDRTA